MADPINPKLTDDEPAEARRLDNEIRKITRNLLRTLAEGRKPAANTGVVELDEDEPD